MRRGKKVHQGRGCPGRNKNATAGIADTKRRPTRTHVCHKRKCWPVINKNKKGKKKSALSALVRGLKRAAIAAQKAA